MLRLITLLALAAFVLLSSAAFTLMAVQAKAFEFWHAWGWFNYIG
jgi:Spy/CpxP family protein refolding chaperone